MNEFGLKLFDSFVFIRKYIYIFLIWISTVSLSHAQSPVFGICDSIIDIARSDYHTAKRHWIDTGAKYEIEPQQELLFLTFSVQHQDIEFIKTEIAKLIRTHGFSVHQTQERYPTIYNLLSDGSLSQWYKENFHDAYETWVLSHHEKMYTINTIDRLYARDQMLVAFSQFDHDSCSVSKNIASTIENNDFENLLEIVRLCKMNNNELPTGYDFAIDTYSKIQMILWHNLKSKNNFQRAWEQLFPYLEKAYFDGKISNSFLYAYDKLSYVHFGYQYYGTISAPVKDEATLKERQQDYKL